MEKKLKIATLVNVKLNRIGSAAGGGFRSYPQKEMHREVENRDAETLRELVIDLASDQGDDRATLSQGLKLSRDQTFRSPTLVFDIQGASTIYSQPYAECEVLTVLRSGERYFRLDEIQVQPNH